jgi:hypothetical protein
VAAALAATGGSTWAATPGGSSGGGAIYVARPAISKVRCIRRCATHRRARGGSTLKLTGTDLRGVRKVVFLGSVGRGDDVSTRVRPGSDRRLNASVPVGAVSGPVAAVVSPALRSRRTPVVDILPAPPPSPNPTLSPAPGSARIETGTSRTKVFYGAQRAVVFSFRLRAPADARVDLLRAGDGATVRSWRPGPVPAGKVVSITWSGALGRSAAPPGRYLFGLAAVGANGAVARSASPSDAQRDAFDLYDDVFPIRGRHGYGGAGNRFGAPRAGHRHQGQDVLARCGTPLVAERAGRIEHKAYQSAAGYYLVVDAAGTNVDYAYMHLAEPTPFAVGDRVYTGQRVGSVGETGDATACHLHMELWRGPWYDGGHPFDPLPALKAWDGWS